MSFTPNMVKNLSFRVETLYGANNNRVGRIKPDSNGIYSGLPLMVLGETTQQNTYYDPQSIVNQITNPESRCNKVLRQQKMFGEYGHPLFIGMSSDEQLQRLTMVEEKNTSHLFTALYTDAPTPQGTVVVRGDVKPTGPYGAVFKESLDDPVVNTAFSLRAYVNTEMKPNGLKYRTVRSLTTFDTVGASGFYGTDKAHAIGLESFSGDQFLDYEIQVMENGNLLIDQIALESYTDSEMNEIFGVPKISKIIQSRTLIETDRSSMERFPNLYKNTLFNDFFKEI
jgi:hypothetical protein